ncbi:hypothetical protein B0O99DRAFT_624154 [Bisporella sp. PMI_857]|nr:hypothetical protein B0O99DRAFT_624154 [Bisporella sp. PMI_857]
MRAKNLTTFLWFFTIADATRNHAECNADNCLRALRNPTASRDSHIFCSAYFPQNTATVTVTQTSLINEVVPTTTIISSIFTTILTTIYTTQIDIETSTKVVITTIPGSASLYARAVTPSIPQYLSACSSSSSRLSSACSCYIGTTASPTTITETEYITRSPSSTATKVSTTLSTIDEPPIPSTITTKSTTTTSITSTILSTPSPSSYCLNSTGPLTTVNLRIEGLSSTIFSGPLTSGPLTITTPSGGTHACTGLNNNVNPFAGATCTSALAVAACLNSFPFDGAWFPEFEDYFITSIASDTQTATQFWGLLRNWEFTPVGGCQQETQEGDEVLWAYDAFNMLYFLQAAVDEAFEATVKKVVAREPVSVYVRDGSTKVPVGGAEIGDAITNGQGIVTLSFGAPGTYTLKATLKGSLRSNAVSIIVR